MLHDIFVSDIFQNFFTFLSCAVFEVHHQPKQQRDKRILKLNKKKDLQVYINIYPM